EVDGSGKKTGVSVTLKKDTKTDMMGEDLKNAYDKALKSFESEIANVQKEPQVFAEEPTCKAPCMCDLEDIEDRADAFMKDGKGEDKDVGWYELSFSDVDAKEMKVGDYYHLPVKGSDPETPTYKHWKITFKVKLSGRYYKGTSDCYN